MKMTKEQIDARYDMYTECIEHLGMSVAETDVEKQEASRLAKQLIKQRDYWYKRVMRSRP